MCILQGASNLGKALRTHATQLHTHSFARRANEKNGTSRVTQALLTHPGSNKVHVSAFDGDTDTGKLQ